MSNRPHEIDDASFWADAREPEMAREREATRERRPFAEFTCFVCGQPGHMAVACPLHPARLAQINGAGCGLGPCTNACRSGDHGDCGFHWCTCRCHAIALPAAF